MVTMTTKKDEKLKVCQLLSLPGVSSPLGNFIYTMHRRKGEGTRRAVVTT